MTQTSNQDLAQRMADLARSLAGPLSVDDVLAEVTSATELIAGATAAAVLLIGTGGTFDSLAGISGLPHQLDALQMRYQADDDLAS